MVNTERIRQLADYLEANMNEGRSDLFNMAGWGHDFLLQYRKNNADLTHCISAACLAGWATALFYNEKARAPMYKPQDFAREMLGLTKSEARKLFTPQIYDVHHWEPREIHRLNREGSHFVPENSNDRRYAQMELDQIQMDDAIATLRFLADCGEVHWLFSADRDWKAV